MTYEELMAKSRALAQAGNIEAAKRAADMAQRMQGGGQSAPSGWVAEGAGPSLTPQQADAILRNAPLGGQVFNNVVGDDDPNSQNLGEKIGSTLNKAGESLTFGVVGDETSAAAESLIPGVNYEDRRDHYRQQERVLERDNPMLALGAEIGGALAGAAVPVLGTMGTLGRGADVLPRVAASAAAGAGMGGTYGFMEGEGVEDRAAQGVTGGALGGVVGALVPAVGAGIQKIADSRAANRAVRAVADNAPTTEELRTAGQAAYRQIDDAGVQIKPSSFSNLRQSMTDRLRGAGLDELPGPGSLTPKSARVMQIAGEMENAMGQDPTAALPFSSLDQLRRHAGTASRSIADKTDSNVGTQAIAEIDDFVRNIGPDDVVAGDVETLQNVLPKARDLWARMTRSQLLDDAIEAGEESYLSGGGTGIKYKFKRLLNDPKLKNSFTDAERKVMSRVVQGTVPEQILRLAGSGLTQIGGTIAAGLGVGPLAGLGTLAASTGARNLSDRVIQRNAEIARALVAGGGLKSLPVATDQARRIAESLMRRTAAAAPQ